MYQHLLHYTQKHNVHTSIFHSIVYFTLCIVYFTLVTYGEADDVSEERLVEGGTQRHYVQRLLIVDHLRLRLPPVRLVEVVGAVDDVIALITWSIRLKHAKVV